MQYPEALARLVEELNKLPGIGPKTAQRLAFHILGGTLEDAEKLAEAILDAKRKIKNCSICGNFTDDDPCRICRSPHRDQSIICVVENARDVAAIERSREFKGLYHVLGGVISPVDGIGPDNLTIDKLLKRVEKGSVKEVVVATNPTVEGEATALYLSRILKPLGVNVTRLAHGIPVGGDLEYTDEVTLARAFEGRRKI
ncbi:MAG TPA: recombination protein RecR [Peptococcaceae bacterium]|nr:MAG: Recombination protein RecR [Clostridia bacterium 41_269]HBT19771.1 recombination protein RecR [Peptococcaceae bacterium]